MICDAILERQWETASKIACPVVYQRESGQSVEQWEPHDWKLLQQACKTITDYGLKAEASKQIIQWIFTAHVNTPSDICNLGHLLLTPSENFYYSYKSGMKGL